MENTDILTTVKHHLLERNFINQLTELLLIEST